LHAGCHCAILLTLKGLAKDYKRSRYKLPFLGSQEDFSFALKCLLYHVLAVQQPLTPVIVELTESATEEITVFDVLIGAASFAGALVIVAVSLATMFAGVLILVRRRRSKLSSKDRIGDGLGLGVPFR